MMNQKLNLIFKIIFYNLFAAFDNKQMSIKTLVFGQNDYIKKMLHHINSGIPQESDDAVRVQHTIINEKNFMIFAIQDRSLITEQAVGSNALVFFIDHERPLYEEKQFLLDVLNSKREFETIPLVVLFEKQQGLNIKDVINYLELFKMKERTSMIKEINFAERQSIIDSFQWIDNQTDFRKSFTQFDAMPKVVKMKPKYRQSEQDESVKKYETLLKDKQFRSKNVKDQEQNYINQEKERIKNENMEKQLANFNKNKKKMTPYDIKATPNPKIEANLHFFLKDPKSQKQPEVNIKIQTDDFKPRPPEKPYVPKKTGINISTQIEQNELFDFDKEVRPILNILVIKALETAALEIEEQEEFARIQKYKAAYNDRVKKQREHQDKKIDEQLALIKKKEKLLEEARKKHQVRKNIKKRLICYDISNRFLENIYKRANLNLFNKNQYFDEYENDIKTNYLEHLVVKTSTELQKLSQKEKLINGVFEKDCIGPILGLAQKPKKQREALKHQAAKRRINESQFERVLNILYKHDSQSYSSFSKFIDKNFDGTLEDFIRTKEEEYQEVSDKVSTGDLPQDELTKKKALENDEFGKTHEAFMIDSEKDVCFTLTPNQYEKAPDNLMSLGFIVVDREGEVIESDFTKKSFTKQHTFARHVKDLRAAKKVVNMDEGMILHLKNVPDNAKSVILLTRFNNVAKYNQEQENKKVKYASYGLEFYEHGVPLHKQNISEKINWTELVKAPEGDQAQQNRDLSVICVSYVLHRKAEDNWNIQHTRHISKPTEDSERYIEELARYYGRSLQIFKEEDDEPEAQEAKKSASRKEKRGKSKKVIEEPPAQKVKVPLKVTSRVLPQVHINLKDGLPKIAEQLDDSIKQWREFAESCQAGWQILFRGKPLQSVDQLKKFKKLGDVTVVKLKPVVEEQEKKEGEQGQAENNRESQDA